VLSAVFWQAVIGLATTVAAITAVVISSRTLGREQRAVRCTAASATTAAG
jgi:hypothetical protein